MEQKYDPCECDEHKKTPKPLSPLILQCWMRENFKRPYNHLYLNRNLFESKLHHKFDLDDYAILVLFLEKRHKIKKFRLQGFEIPDSQISNLHENFADTLKYREELELVDLKIKSIFFKHLFDEPSFSNIKVLRLSGTFLSENVAHYLRCFLLQNDVIEFLDVGSCNITERKFSIIADGVYKSSSIRAFNMNRLILYDRGDYMDTTRIASIIAQLIWKNQLVEIHLRYLSLNSSDMIPIAEYIGNKNSNLKYLDMASNAIGTDGVQILFTEIMRSKKLLGLDLSHNQFGTDGGDIISFSLPFTNIKYLNIAHNDIDYLHTRFIINTIKKAVQLKILNIYGNRFDPYGMYSLKRQVAAKTHVIDDIDIDIIFDHDRNQFYWAQQIKLPEIFGEYVNRFNLMEPDRKQHKILNK